MWKPSPPSWDLLQPSWLGICGLGNVNPSSLFFECYVNLTGYILNFCSHFQLHLIIEQSNQFFNIFISPFQSTCSITSIRFFNSKLTVYSVFWFFFYILSFLCQQNYKYTQEKLLNSVLRSSHHQDWLLH